MIYVDDTVADATPFGTVRQRAYKIMPRNKLQITGQRLSVKPVSKLALHWQAVDSLTERICPHLRPLYVALDFTSTVPDSPWLAALAWAKNVFAKQQRLSQRPLAELSGGHVAETIAAVPVDLRCRRQVDRIAR